MNIGQKLKSARSKVNLTIAEVATQTGIGESSLSEIENGKREPKISQLNQLSRVYRHSIAFFLDEENEEETAQRVLWRLRPEEQAVLLEREFLKLCEQYRLLEEWNDDFIEPMLPYVGPTRHALNFADVAQLAQSVGRELNLGDRPAFVLLRVLEEDCGIKVFHRAFEPRGTAACIKSKQHGWAVLLNANNSTCRRHFDLVHELFHLLVWDLYRGDGTAAPPVSPEFEEKLANAFASNLLIPEEALRRTIDRKRNGESRLSVSDIPNIAEQFGVSVEALVWRIHRLYNISDEQKTRDIIQSLQAVDTRKPDTDGAQVIPTRLPMRYQRLAIQTLRRGDMSIGKFMEFMEISRREAMKYMEAEEYALGEIQLTPA